MYKRVKFLHRSTRCGCKYSQIKGDSLHFNLNIKVSFHVLEYRTKRTYCTTVQILSDCTVALYTAFKKILISFRM